VYRPRFGWAEPEPAMTASTSAAGGAVLCDGAPNLSFWTHVNPGPVTLPYNRRETQLDPTAYYITWQSNEGDTPKIMAALQVRGCGCGCGYGRGKRSRVWVWVRTALCVSPARGPSPVAVMRGQQEQWLDPRRGSIPIAWGIDPLVLSVSR
jgi:hypothetical protein